MNNNQINNNYTTQTPMMQNNIPNYVDKQPKKKRKKHIGLWIILTILILTVSIFGIKVWRNSVATDYLNNILSDQPFGFSNADYIDYVTEDIKIPNKIEISEEKFEEIEWESNNEDILTSNGIVTRPTTSNTPVELTATIKHRFGKGQKTFYLTVIKSDKKSIEDIYVLTQEEISSGKGRNNIEITYDKNKNIETISGNLGSTKVENSDDVLTVIKAYSKLLNIENLSFTVSNINSSLDGKQYTCTQIYNNLPVLSKQIVITTNNKDCLDSITVNVAKNIKVNTSNKLSQKEIEKIVTSEMGKTTVVVSTKEIVTEKDNKFYHVYSISTLNEEKNELYNILIDINSKKIISKKSLLSKATSENVKSTAADVFGETQTFYVNKESGLLNTQYRFEDTGRNIRIVNGDSLGLLIDLLINGEKVNVAEHLDEKNYEIHSGKNDFSKYPDGVSAYTNLITTYDWYKNNLNRTSFDGKGMPINCLIKFSASEDNASYISNFKVFGVGEVTKFKYILSGGLDVMGHEYTHAVFHSITGDQPYSTTMHDTINEAYADIFGCLIDGDWDMGLGLVADDTVFRDSTFKTEHINYLEGKFPTEYLGENWQDECHADSVVLSHVAYAMTENGFSDNDVANIWYQSLFYGVPIDADFIDIRHNVERAAEKLGYSDEQISTIGKLFDKVKIKEKEKIKIENYSVDGDMFKDDTQTKNFLVVWSPIASILGKSPIMIFEEDNSIEQSYSDEEIARLLSDYYSGLLNEEISDSEYQFNIQFDYRRMPKFAINMCKNFATDAKNNMLTQISDTTGQSEEETDDWFGIIFLVQNYEGTSYEFWTEFMGMDFSQIEWKSTE